MWNPNLNVKNIQNASTGIVKHKARSWNLLKQYVKQTRTGNQRMVDFEWVNADCSQL